jgi:hypothetical protein
MTFNEITRTYAQVVAQSWSNPQFLAQLTQNPAQTLQTFGVTVPPGMTIQVLQNTSDNYYVALQDKPENIVGIAPGLTGEQVCESSCFGTAGTIGTAGSACGTFGTAASIGTCGCWNPF